MSFGRFLWLLIVKPRQALEQGKGRFLMVSLLLGGLTGGASGYLFWLLSGVPIPVGLLRVTLVGLVSFPVIAWLYHRLGLHYSEGSASWSEFVSLFGFAWLPSLLNTLFTFMILLFVGMHSAYYPGLVSYGSGWLFVTAGFGVAMDIAVYIYQGLILQVVHKLPWKRVLAVIAIAWLAKSILLTPIGRSLITVTNVPWQTAALMTEGVEKIEINSIISSSIETRKPTYQVGELILTSLPQLTINQQYYSDVTVKSGRVLAEIMARPEDTVELRNGNLWVNGLLVQEASTPLLHLSMEARQLPPNQYFVYFRSPQALGASFNPESLIVAKSKITAAVPDSTLAYFEWQLR